MNKKYIVIWIIRKEVIGRRYDNKKIVEKDCYQVFIDEDDNEKAAMDFYESKRLEDDTYSCNLCEIIESTDY